LSENFENWVERSSAGSNPASVSHLTLSSSVKVDNQYGTAKRDTHDRLSGPAWRRK